MSVIRQELYRILESLPDAALAEIINWLKRQWLPTHTNGKKLSTFWAGKSDLVSQQQWAVAEAALAGR